ncbi:hypothetical protein TIFTF001_017145 [Ficus carica]|uniref:Uncharacterized protein n=1 Tax=Ficus carica TaxID=3494 RepID=A0AA88A8Q4_FICCA|nr:hypothetical protein TIFTF001_017145 [Ficus carica]
MGGCCSLQVELGYDRNLQSQGYYCAEEIYRRSRAMVATIDGDN